MKKIPKFASPKKTINIFSEIIKENKIKDFAIVKNPEYIFPPLDFYPLAPKSKGIIPKLVGVVKDMDGTTTTTEPLCLHSLEYMIRKITNRMDKNVWSGLDRKIDYPHIIGNSTTRHVEYLIQTYADKIDIEVFKRAYILAAIWTLSVGKDEGRRREVLANLAPLGLEEMKSDSIFLDETSKGTFNLNKATLAAISLYEKYGSKIDLSSFNNKVRAAIDIYYTRYHEILVEISKGKGEKLSKELFGSDNRRLIEPMPGVAVFLALIKGWLGKDVAKFYNELKEHTTKNTSRKIIKTKYEKIKKLLPALGCFFEKNPAKVAVVTSSIAYEANIVLNEVFGILKNQVSKWDIEQSKKDFITEKFSSPYNTYEAIITASDSSEIRLKPHRDLYSIALNQLGISPEDFPNVAGFEDSESGTIAIRAAGIGLCIAVPFSDTQHHNLDAAAFINTGGLPETIIADLCYIDPKRIKKCV